MSNLGKWAPWYDKPDIEQTRYGDDDIAYQLGAEWHKGLSVEDWGCGLGWFRRFHDGPYLGIDGTASPFADIVTDLTRRRLTVFNPQGIFLRGVLEHNVEWRKILDNALASATKRIFIGIFTPNGNGEIIDTTEELGVPDIALPWDEVGDIIREAGWDTTFNVRPTSTHYGREAFWWCLR